MAHTVVDRQKELGDEAPSSREAALEAPALLRIVWADPEHVAEQLAVWSLARFGPVAGAAVERLRAGEPAADRELLEGLLIQRQTRVATAEGAFVGGPFVVLVPVAFCAALLAQAQLVFELAAVSGRDPNDQMRAADLLVLLGAYPSAEAAAAGLAAMPRAPQEHEGKRLPAGTRRGAGRRLADPLGGLGAADPGPRPPPGTPRRD